MIIEINKTTTTENLKNSLEHFRKNKSERKKSDLTEFFGILPNIGDGLEFQKNARNEWD